MIIISTWKPKASKIYWCIHWTWYFPLHLSTFFSFRENYIQGRSGGRERSGQIHKEWRRGCYPRMCAVKMTTYKISSSRWREDDRSHLKSTVCPGHGSGLRREDGARWDAACFHWVHVMMTHFGINLVSCILEGRHWFHCTLPEVFLCLGIVTPLFLSSWVSNVDENYFHFCHKWHLGLKRHLCGPGQCKSWFTVYSSSCKSTKWSLPAYMW